MQPARPLLRWIAAALLVTGSGVGGYYLANRMRVVPEKPSPPLVLSASSRMLVDLREGEVTSHKLTIENGGTEEIHISRFHGDCRCTSFRPTTLAVPPGSSAEVELEIRLGPVSGERFELLVVADAKGVDSGKDLKAQWTLSGRVVRDADLSAYRVDFGELTEDQLGKATRQVKVRAKAPLKWVTAASRTEAIRAESVGPDITLRAMGPLPMGQLQGEVAVSVKFKGRERPVDMALWATLRVLSEIEVIPERILAGRRKVGTKAQEEVILASRTGKRLKVAAMGVTGSGMKVEGLAVDNGSGIRLRVEYEVMREGADERSTWVDVQQAGEDRVRRVIVPVKVAAY